MIKEIKTDDQILECTKVIRNSFITVANEFGITSKNAPTNPAFITYEKMKDSIGKGANIFALFEDNIPIGCVAVEKSKNEPEVFFIERLAVLLEHRHKGYGKKLLDYACQSISDNKGKKIQIGIVDENIKLKNWYIDYGFNVIGTKKFDHLPFTVCFMEKII